MKKARSFLVQTSQRLEEQGTCHLIPALGQQKWLKVKDLPLKGESKKLVPRFVGPFMVDKVVNPKTLSLKLPSSMKVHPSFHISQLGPGETNNLALSCRSPPPPMEVDGRPVFTVHRLLNVQQLGEDSTFWSPGRGINQKNGVRSLIDRLLIPPSSRTSIVLILKTFVPQMVPVEGGILLLLTHPEQAVLVGGAALSPS